MNAEKGFAAILLDWNRNKNNREMPWKGEKNPYFIWLSEIILQQTKVEQGLPYFLRFKEKYPTVRHLAEAHEDEVMRMWQGLGYYSRARNLHETAKAVQFKLGGRFPLTYLELKQLKGVGEYTASAIASFAYGEAKAVVDGNVIRVLARVFGIETPFDTTEGKKQFAELAEKLLNKESPAIYNQAIMDFGASVCVPAQPDCLACPFSKNCAAFNSGTVDLLPVRQNKIKKEERHFNYLLIRNEAEIIIQKRTANDIWKDLYELPLIETEKVLKNGFRLKIEEFLGDGNFEIKTYSKKYTQLLTHRKINARFIEIEAPKLESLKLKNTQKIKLKDLQNFAFPKTVHLYLIENSLL